jgi:hypothetical protein
MAMMRFALLLIATTGLVRADDPPPDLLPLSSIKAVIFPETRSPDGQYILAWTILPEEKNGKSFDWSGWNSAEPTALLTKPGWDWEDLRQEGMRYHVHDLLVDLTQKRWVDLRSDLPTWWHKGFGPITVAWEPSPQGARHGLVQNPGHFGSLELWLVTADKVLRVQDITRAADHAVAALARARKIDDRNLQIWYGIDPGGRAAAVFSNETVTFGFNAGTTRESLLMGTCTVRLDDGKVVAAKGATR